MKSPSMDTEKGESVIMPLAKIHATPTKGMMPSKEKAQGSRDAIYLLFFDFFFTSESDSTASLQNL